MDLATLAQNALAAGVAGAGSFIASVTQIKKKVDRLERQGRVLKEAFEKLQSEAVFESSLDSWKESIVTGLRLDWETLKNEVEKRTNQVERHSDHTGQSAVAIERRVSQLETDIGKLENKEYIPRSEYNEFVKDQIKQWNENNRLLGEIRGAMIRK